MVRTSRKTPHMVVTRLRITGEAKCFHLRCRDKTAPKEVFFRTASDENSGFPLGSDAGDAAIGQGSQRAASCQNRVSGSTARSPDPRAPDLEATPPGRRVEAFVPVCTPPSSRNQHDEDGRPTVAPFHLLRVTPQRPERQTIPVVIPWIIFAVVAVPLVVGGFVATRRRKVAAEHPASEDAQARAQTEQEFAEAEAYEAKWREEDKETFHQERLP
jgi:hypothetical protein